MMHNSFFLALSLGVVLSLSNNAIAQESLVVKHLKNCRQIIDNEERLTCFDNLSKDDSLAALNVETFASEQIKTTTQTASKNIESISLNINTLTKNAYGQWLITLENDQQWQQKDSVRLNLTAQQKIVISKGAFGATYLRKQDGRKRIQVKRIK